MTTGCAVMVAASLIAGHAQAQPERVPPKAMVPPYQKPPALVYPDAPVPTTGALVIETAYDFTPEVTVTVFNSTEMVSGQVTQLGDFWVWTPDGPLPVGMLSVSMRNLGGNPSAAPGPLYDVLTVLATSVPAPPSRRSRVRRRSFRVTCRGGRLETGV